jgi:hypothetical protein
VRNERGLFPRKWPSDKPPTEEDEKKRGKIFKKWTR